MNDTLPITSSQPTSFWLILHYHTTNNIQALGVPYSTYHNDSSHCIQKYEMQSNAMWCSQTLWSTILKTKVVIIHVVQANTPIPASRACMHVVWMNTLIPASRAWMYVKQYKDRVITIISTNSTTHNRNIQLAMQADKTTNWCIYYIFVSL